MNAQTPAFCHYNVCNFRRVRNNNNNNNIQNIYSIIYNLKEDYSKKLNKVYNI